VEQIPYLIVVVGLYAKFREKFQIFEDLEKKLELFLNSTGSKRFPILSGLFLQIKVDIVIHQKQYNMLPSISSKLEALVPHLKFYPRDSFTYLLLAKLIKLHLNLETLEEISKTLIKHVELNKDHIRINLLNSINEYIDLLKNDFQGGKQYFDQEIIPWVTDPNSIIIPDLTKISNGNKIRKNWKYNPFNLSANAVYFSNE
jgi:hypothetical protein